MGIGGMFDKAKEEASSITDKAKSGDVQGARDQAQQDLQSAQDQVTNPGQ